MDASTDKSFLWSGVFDSKRSLVAWSKVSKPFDEGGLSFKELLAWDKTLVFKFGYDIFMRKSNLWTLWVYQNLVRRNNFWIVNSSGKDSWVWRFVLKLRNAILQSIQVSSPHGSNTDDFLVFAKPDGKMNCKIVYDVFRTHMPIQNWCSLLWHGIQSRKWGFICWLDGLNRLPTTKKLFNWGLLASNRCILCGHDEESEDHEVTNLVLN